MMDSGAVYSLSLFAAMITMLLMGIVYALGSLLQNPRLTVWVKTEIFHVFVSIALVFITLFLVGLVGAGSPGDFSIEAGTITELASDSMQYKHPSIGDDDTIYEASTAYMTNVAFFVHKSVRGVRATMGAFDEYTKFSKQPCLPGWLFCLMGHNGASMRPLSGAAALYQSGNMLLYMTSAAYLTVLAQLMLLDFVKAGVLAIYLPIAIILRSLPFMRQFGGGLLAIVISLSIVYPALLFVEASFWNPWAILPGVDTTQNLETQGDYKEVKKLVDEVEGDSYFLSYGDLYFSSGDWRFNDILESMKSVIMMSSASFLVSTFLFTFNIIAVTAAAKSFGRLLGADVDLSRLVQIV